MDSQVSKRHRRSEKHGEGGLPLLVLGAMDAASRVWAQGTHLSHVYLGSLLEHRSARHIEALLQPIEPQGLHLLIAALHLQGVVRQLGQLLHVLQGAGPHG